MHQVIGIQALYHEKSTLKVRKVTKLHYCDSTSSNDEFSSYAQSIKLISTRSATHPVNNETLDLYPEGVTLSKFIHEGRPTTMKPTFVALPSLTSHSTSYECLRSILCKPQESPHSLLTRLGVIISYSLHLKRKITSPSTSIISPYVYSEPSDETKYDAYTASPTKKTTSLITEVKIDKSIQFQVNRLNTFLRYKQQSVA